MPDPGHGEQTSPGLAALAKGSGSSRKVELLRVDPDSGDIRMPAVVLRRGDRSEVIVVEIGATSGERAASPAVGADGRTVNMGVLAEKQRPPVFIAVLPGNEGVLVANRRILVAGDGSKLELADGVDPARLGVARVMIRGLGAPPIDLGAFNRPGIDRSGAVGEALLREEEVRQCKDVILCLGGRDNDPDGFPRDGLFFAVRVEDGGNIGLIPITYAEARKQSGARLLPGREVPKTADGGYDASKWPGVDEVEVDMGGGKKVKAWKFSITGDVRPIDEDFVGVAKRTNRRGAPARGAVLLVADGMGGHEGGEIASAQAGGMIVGLCGAEASTTTVDGQTGAPNLEEAVGAANRSVCRLRQAKRKDLGTTVAAVEIGDDRSYHIVYAGDSRVYVFDGNQIVDVTRDHSLVERLVDVGEITPQEALKHPQRNVIYKCLGDKPKMEPEIKDGRLGHDGCVLVCCDGLSGWLQKNYGENGMNVLFNRALEMSGKAGRPYKDLTGDELLAALKTLRAEQQEKVKLGRVDQATADMDDNVSFVFGKVV